jgi:hypothetical protein
MSSNRVALQLLSPIPNSEDAREGDWCINGDASS